MGVGLALIVLHQNAQDSLLYRGGYTLYMMASMFLLLQGLCLIRWFVEYRHYPRFLLPLALVLTFTMPCGLQFVVVLAPMTWYSISGKSVETKQGQTVRDIMDEKSRRNIWQSVRIGVALIGTVLVVYGICVNQALWTAVGFASVLLVYYLTFRSNRLRKPGSTIP